MSLIIHLLNCVILLLREKALRTYKKSENSERRKIVVDFALNIILYD